MPHRLMPVTILISPFPCPAASWFRYEFLDMFIHYVIFLTEMSFLSPAKVAIPFILSAICIKKMTEMSFF